MALGTKCPDWSLPIWALGNRLKLKTKRLIVQQPMIWIMDRDRIPFNKIAREDHQIGAAGNAATVVNVS